MDKLEKDLCKCIDDIMCMKGISIHDEGKIIELEEKEYYIFSKYIDKYLLLRTVSRMLKNGSIKLNIEDAACNSDVEFLKELQEHCN